MKGVHFTPESLEEMGKDLCFAILVAFGREGAWSVPRPMGKGRGRRSVLGEGGVVVTKSKAKEELLADPRLLHQGDGDSSSGSDSDASNENAEEPSEVLPRSSTRLVLKLPGPSFRSKRSLLPKARKCSECGLDMNMGHVCPQRIVPSPTAESSKQVVAVGVKTYYTVQGKKVHDQVTQTKVSFYAHYKANKEKAAQIQQTQVLRAPTITIEPESTPEPATRLQLAPALPSALRVSTQFMQERVERFSLSQSFVTPDSKQHLGRKSMFS